MSSSRRRPRRSEPPRRATSRALPRPRRTRELAVAYLGGKPDELALTDSALR